MPQAQIAQMLGKSGSAWSKVESGDIPLSLDHLFAACAAMQIWPASFMQTVQNYVSLLNQNGWFVSWYGVAPIPKEDDALWIASDEFYGGKIKSNAFPIIAPILNTPWPYVNAYAPIPVFDAAINKLNSSKD